MLSAWSMNHKSHLKTPFWTLLQKPALARCHCLHATATTEYEDIRRVGLRMPVAVIPNGVDIPREVPGEQRRKRIVFLSRIDPKKGLDMLLPAWCAVAPHHAEWELVIAGPLNGSYADEIRSLARRLRTPRVHFADQVLGEEKRSLFAGAALFVLPSYSENFGIAIAEALAHRLPVITTRETPWQELPARGCGWCIPATEEALREALGDALNRPIGELLAMGEVGCKWMQRDYTWSRIADRMRCVYEWLLHGDAPPECVVID
jgi:glycosyltransferase involved in cell wall biosynthesis